MCFIEQLLKLASERLFSEPRFAKETKLSLEVYRYRKLRSTYFWKQINTKNKLQEKC